MIRNCKMRHENGNCLPAGGFCTANKNICEALQNAYEMGQRNAIALPSADKDSLYKILNEAHNEGYDVGYWAGRRDYEQKWTPCSERPPETDDVYLVTVHPDYIPPECKQVDRMYYLKGEWLWLNEKAEWEKWPDPIIAWMPLPEPYKAETE